MLTSAIYAYFDGIRQEKEKQEAGPVDHVSPSYFNKCIRQLWYKKSNTPASNPLESHSYIKFELGHATHEKIQNVLKEMGLWVRGETFQEKHFLGFKWVYRIDGEIKDKNGNRYIMEIKSIYASGYTAKEKEADADHELQLYFYMLLENIDRGIILYIGRDNGRMIEYHYTKETLQHKYGPYIQERQQKLHRLFQLLETKELPEREYNAVFKNVGNELSDSFQKDNLKYKTDWQCSYCQWKGLCWDDVIQGMKEYKFYYNGGYCDKIENAK
jgi:hypothetical protein